MKGYLRKGLHSPNALLYSVIFSLSLAVAVRCFTNRWSSQMRLRSRVIVLASVKKIVEEWEGPCLLEVDKLMTASTTVDVYHKRFLNLHEENEKVKSDVAPFHGAVCSMAYAPAVNVGQWLRLWYVGRYLCASAVEDMLWMQRLGYIIKFVAFRRLTLMAEARYYAALWHSALYGGSGEHAAMDAPAPRMPLWLVGRRPFWIVPLSGKDSGHYLCLPLSYFPVEAILTSTAEETWIKKLVDILPLLTEEFSLRYISDTLRTRRTIRLVRLLFQWKFPSSWQQLWNEIDRLFLTYAAPLAKGQLRRGEAACRRFYEEKLFEGVELVTGEGIDMEDEEDGAFYPTRNKRKRCVGCDVLLRDVRVSRRLQMLLRLRSLSHAVRVGIGLMAPQYNFFAEWMLLKFLSPTTTDGDRHKILMGFSGHVLRDTLAAIMRAVIWSLDDYVKANICAVLRNELHHELNVKLATADEAFLRRCIEEGIAGRDNPVEKSSAYAGHVASQILGRFDYERRGVMARIIVVLLSTWRHEVGVALFAAIVALFDYHETAHVLSCWLGITVHKELYHELAQMEEEGPPPAEPRYGLRLMMDVLAGEGGRNEETRPRTYRRNKTFHPCLALIVCGGTFLLDWPLSANIFPESNDDATTRHHLKALERLLDDVINGGDYSLVATESSTCRQKICGGSLVESLRLNAAFVREFVLKVALQTSEAPVNAGIGTRDFGKGHALHKRAESILHPEEIALLQNPQGMSHIPRTLSFHDVFDKPPRFILRQLGLETVFAYRAAMVANQNEFRSLTESLVDFVSSPFHNVFTRTFVHLMEFTERVIFYAIFSPYVKSPWKSWPIIRHLVSPALCGSGVHRTGEDTFGVLGGVSLLGRMSGYRATLKMYGDDSFGFPFLLCVQLSRHLPTTLHDASPTHYAPPLMERRRAWRRVIQLHGEVEFDNIGRIVGGFSLLKGIDFFGVYFAYPQLHHHVEDGSLQPTLSNITVRFPVGQMTAITGPTGSGKSTMISLLKRMYDPLPKLRINEECNAWCNSQALIDVLRHCLCASTPPTTDGTVNNIILIDNIPIGCFSTSYLRSAVGMLEQAPCIFERLTYYENFSLFAPGVFMEDVVRAAKLCCCEGFVESRALAYDGFAGPLSSGEKQRLALARAILIGCRGLKVLLCDEPTARLDGYNESLVEEALRGLLGPPRCMTIVVVSHRLSTIRNATHVVVLNEGHVEFQGFLKDARKSCWYFQRIAEAQALHA
ncbi:ABC transporter [Trypanosoma cruzi cruzi]|nr:ABC transporter [Trypanosoma cruzi cruzi]